MRFKSARLAPIVVVLFAACGGQVEGTDAMGQAPSSSEAEEVTGPPLPEDGEWGTWQLIAVDTAAGPPDYDPPFIELDLRPTGKAYLWRCSVGPTGNGKRCPYEARRDCFVGSISVSGATWSVQFANKEGSQTAGRGEIVDEPSGDITVKGEGIVPAGGHYWRVGAATHDGCAP